MASEWLQLGAKMRVSISGGAYSKEGNNGTIVVDAPLPIAVRVGRASNLVPRLGYVIRAVTAAVEVTGLDYERTTTAAIAPSSMAQPLVATPNPSSKYPGRWRWEWSAADTTLPLGMLYPAAADVNSPEWGGVAISSVTMGIGAGPQRIGFSLGACDIRYLVSPKPQWQFSAPPTLGTGQTGQIALRVAYPDGEPVVGLRIRFRSETNAVALGPEQAYSKELTTDNAGSITVPVSAVSNGTAAVHIELADKRCAPEFFSPPLVAMAPINATVVRVDGVDCVLIPAVAAIPPVPATRTDTSTYAWDAGANSDQVLSGNVVVSFSGAQAVVGAIVGLTDDRDAVPDQTRIAHGFYLYTDANGATLAQAYERGKSASVAVEYGPDTAFRIERRGSIVRYYVDDHLVRTSQNTLGSEVSVGAALFGTGDYLFEAAEAGT